MAEGKIKYTDLFDADLVAKITALKTEIEALRKLAAKLKTDIPKTGSKPGDTEKLNKAQAERVRLQEKLQLLEKGEYDLNQKLKQQISDKLRQQKTEIQNEKALNAVINKEVKSEQDLINKVKALTAKRKLLDQTTVKGAKEHKKLTAEIQRGTAELKKQDAAIGNHQRKVGNYTGALKNFGSQLMGALGITVGLASLVRVFRSVINTSKDFEKQTATLAGVLDVTMEETKQLTNQAIRLGGAYPTLAKEVLNLQTAYARLGFTQQEILKLTEPTIKGSFALNAELGDTAELVGAVVKSYDELSSTDAGNIIDQLTKSTQRSSLNFEALSTALPKVAGAANAINMPLNETLALLGTSIDATQDASIAGTSLRKIILSNAKANRDLNTGLNIINESTNKVSTAQELYGDRAAVVALALANQIGKTQELSKEINNSLGVATRTAEKQMNTLQGSIDGVSSAWERFVLSTNNSGGVLKDIADGAAAAINSMTDLPDTGTAGTTAGAAILSFFGFGSKAKKRIREEVTAEYDYFKSLSIEKLNEIIPQQEQIIQSYRDEGNDFEVRSEERKLGYLKKLIDERTKLEADAAILKAEKLKEELKKQEEEDYNATIKAIEERKRLDNEELERRKAIEQSYIDFAKEAERDLIITIKDITEQADKIDEEYINRKIERRTEATDKFIKEMKREQGIGDELADWDELNEAQKIGRIQNTLEVSKNAFAENTVAYKALATAQASIDTYASATAAFRAMASIPVVGPALGVIAAAAAIAAGLANVAKINGVKFEKGEVDIQGRRHSQGGIPAEIEGGESVINRTGTARSKETLELINSGLISDKDIIPALALNFNRVPKVSVNNDFSLLASKQDQTNELLKKFKFMSADGKKVMDINGNIIRYV